MKLILLMNMFVGVCSVAAVSAVKNRLSSKYKYKKNERTVQHVNKLLFDSKLWFIVVMCA